jgi:hypothetical protein
VAQNVKFIPISNAQKTSNCKTLINKNNPQTSVPAICEVQKKLESTVFTRKPSL